MRRIPDIYVLIAGALAIGESTHYGNFKAGGLVTPRRSPAVEVTDAS